MERGGQDPKETQNLPVVFQGAMFPCSDFTNFPPLFTMQIRNKMNDTYRSRTGRWNRPNLSPQHLSPPVAPAHLQDTKPPTRKVSFLLPLLFTYSHCKISSSFCFGKSPGLPSRDVNPVSQGMGPETAKSSTRGGNRG